MSRLWDSRELHTRSSCVLGICDYRRLALQKALCYAKAHCVSNTVCVQDYKCIVPMVETISLPPPLLVVNSCTSFRNVSVQIRHVYIHESKHCLQIRIHKWSVVRLLLKCWNLNTESTSFSAGHGMQPYLWLLIHWLNIAWEIGYI